MPELKTQEERTAWAKMIFGGIREVQALHHPITHYVTIPVGDEEEQTFETVEDADAHGGPYASFVACQECSRINATEYIEFPCATAIALGIENGPIL